MSHDSSNFYSIGRIVSTSKFIEFIEGAPHRFARNVEERRQGWEAVGLQLMMVLARVQCIPTPLSRASTTSLLALSTHPLPIG